jgi:hypothetical protein
MRSSVVFRHTVAEETNGYFGNPEVFDFSNLSRAVLSIIPLTSRNSEPMEEGTA